MSGPRSPGQKGFWAEESRNHLYHGANGMTIYRMERSFRERNVPFAKGTYFIRKEGFIQTFQVH